MEDVLTDIQTEKHFIKGLRKNVQAKETQLQGLTSSYEHLNKELEKEKTFAKTIRSKIVR